MNLILVALVSVILATGVFNTELKDKVNKKTETILKDSPEKKPTKEKVIEEAKAQATRS